MEYTLALKNRYYDLSNHTPSPGDGKGLDEWLLEDVLPPGGGKGRLEGGLDGRGLDGDVEGRD